MNLRDLNMRHHWNFPTQPCLRDQLVMEADVPQRWRVFSVPCSRQVGYHAFRLLTLLAHDSVHAESSGHLCLLATAVTQMLLFSETLVADNLPHPEKFAQNVHQSEHDKGLDTYTLSDMFSLPSSHLSFLHLPSKKAPFISFAYQSHRSGS